MPGECLIYGQKNKQRLFSTSNSENTPDFEKDNSQLDSGLAFHDNTKPFSISSAPINTKQKSSKLIGLSAL